MTRPLHPLHARYMARAFELARLGLGRTSPNPPVGAVVVSSGRIVGEGFHGGPGRPHAEIVALRRAGPAARGADCYVTLEPCCHFGRTPGCAQALAAAGIARVFFAAADPDPHVCGRGANTLQAAGIEALHGPMTDFAKVFYAAYIWHRRHGMPWISAKVAASLDGKVATATGQSRWISSEASRQLVHQWRDEYDAVMVGVGTVLADNPSLTCRRGDRPGRHPLRVVVDSQARTPPDAPVVTGPGDCIVAVTERAPEHAVRALTLAGATVWRLPADEGGRVDLRALAKRLGSVGVVSALLEGGPTLLAAAIAYGIVNELMIFYAPMVIGGATAPGIVGGTGVETLDEAGGWMVQSVERVGEDVLVRAVRCSPAS
ncbi:MAG: bifunctional diaminohydroxyphosphoribosylaminopyrimidine deaminase/5-amino-6-(5-phosphoribosylamino)uracil reductase RibD [Armatimonadetes bacterium]|nr:bifunctional diaminohydroxyphosphoribosylaminopyrimidine deaminase/5-amino-6-(5-phosphoribosylamino)uracil reductase RibD [Armatimonadota bacterium]